MRWREYVPVAWQVDPALALSLQDHFPANSDIKHALEALVVEHAHAAKVGQGRARQLLTAAHGSFASLTAFSIWSRARLGW